jgi:hypothetical protein
MEGQIAKTVACLSTLSNSFGIIKPMRNKEVLELSNSINKLGNLKGVKFAYATSRNKKILQNESESLLEAQKESESFTEYENKRVEIAKKYAKKDTQGEPVTEVHGRTRKFVIEDQSGFDAELEILGAEYKETLEEREKQLKDFQELLEQEADVVLFKVAIADVPEDISVEQMGIVNEFIENE